MLTNARVATNLPLLGYSISEISIFGLKLQERRISHGRKNKQKQKHLPRNYTELHGNKNKQKQKTNTEGRISRRLATD